MFRLPSFALLIVMFGSFVPALIWAADSDTQNANEVTDYREIPGSGKPDPILCGFNVNKTAMKTIFAKLGKPDDKKIPDPNEPNFVNFLWAKGPLHITIGAYTNYKYPNLPPVSIEVSGGDPEGFCKSGRGLMLGDTVDKAAQTYQKKPAVIDTQTVDYKWGEEDTGVEISFSKDKNVSRIQMIQEN